MRRDYPRQLRLDCPAVLAVVLNRNCRDEIIPILRALQHLYRDPSLLHKILQLIADDVNAHSRADCGREGMTYWQILVLAAVRLGCNLDYDKLQDLAENHRKLRHIMNLGDWDKQVDFSSQRIRDNLCLIRPETLKRINELIVAEGHRLVPDAAKAVRGDAFVAETNVHYPTESRLILDGLEKLLTRAPRLAEDLKLTGWRQHESLWRKAKKLARAIGRIAQAKGPEYRPRLQKPYAQLLRLAELVCDRTQTLLDEAVLRHAQPGPLTYNLLYFHAATVHVCDTARRRIFDGETVPNTDKLFSVFEPHTQLIKRGKTPNPVQFGHVVFVVEDAAGFLCDYHVLPRGQHERDRVVPVMTQLQERFQGRIQRASFDRGFHSPENQRELAKIVRHPCLPRPGAKAEAAPDAATNAAPNAAANAAPNAAAAPGADETKVIFRATRRRHSGIESAIGALQAGNGLKRCRDRSFTGYCRYVGLAVLGRNLHRLGHIVLAQEDPLCLAAASQRKPLAA